MLGWKWVLSDRILKRMGKKEIRLKVKGMDHRVACRLGTDDIYEYMQSLGSLQVPLEFPSRPAFIVDAGANVGYSALRFQKEFPGATIIALEPEPRNLVQFRKNCTAFSNIILEDKALWATTARLKIRTLDAAVNAFQVEEDPTGDVEALCIEDIMKRHGLPRIDLLKVDVEGSEKAIFSHPSAKNWVHSVGMILIEMHDRMEPGCTETVERTLGSSFDCRGHINEYVVYVSRQGRLQNFRSTAS